jgi:hypothetical protein
MLPSNIIYRDPSFLVELFENLEALAESLRFEVWDFDVAEFQDLGQGRGVHIPPNLNLPEAFAATVVSLDYGSRGAATCLRTLPPLRSGEHLRRPIHGRDL